MKIYEVEEKFEKLQEKLDKFLLDVNGYRNRVEQRLNTLKNRYKNPNDNQREEIQLLESTIYAIDIVLDSLGDDAKFVLNMCVNDDKVTRSF